MTQETTTGFESIHKSNSLLQHTYIKRNTVSNAPYKKNSFLCRISNRDNSSKYLQVPKSCTRNPSFINKHPKLPRISIKINRTNNKTLIKNLQQYYKLKDKIHGKYANMLKDIDTEEILEIKHAISKTVSAMTIQEITNNYDSIKRLIELQKLIEEEDVLNQYYKRNKKIEQIGRAHV